MSDTPLRGVGKSSSSHVSSLKFTKLLSPKMKSVYWPYFGFPINENDRIITKQNVVCTLCHKVLTNHGNTTNLRAHLQHRHKDIFSKVCSENGIKIPPRRLPKPTSMRRDLGEKKVKLEYSDPTTQDSSNNASIGGDDQAILYETMVPITYEDDEVIDSTHFAKIEVRSGVSLGASTAEKSDILHDSEMECGNSSSNNNSKIIEVKNATISNYREDVIEEIDPFQLQDSIVNMLIQDLRNVNFIYDTGMLQLMRTLCGNNLPVPPSIKLESLIRELHSDKLTTMGDQIKMHSHIKPYSLGFEIWMNVEQKHFISIYFNYTTDAPDYSLLNQLFGTYDYNKFTSFDTIFVEFNLQNCTAAILGYDHNDYEEDFLKQYLESKSIPVIIAYDITVDKCLKNVFALPAVAMLIDEVKEVIMRYSSEINSKEVEIPIVNTDFPWTYYDLLKFFAESVSWPEDVDSLVASAKSITETLNPLSITLDTLKGDDIPQCSMLSPITSKILAKRFSVSQTDDDLVISIKETVTHDLQKLVIMDDHLTIAALLDPRFHRLTNVDNLNNCLDILSTKFNKICEMEGCTADNTTSPTSTIKMGNFKKENTSGVKKSNLELFFDIQESIEAKPIQEVNNIENDLKRYRNEVYATLDESPLIWWSKMGHVYGALKRMATQYQCVPSVVHMGFKKSIKEQMYEHQKRYMLTGNLIDEILFLHYTGKNV